MFNITKLGVKSTRRALGVFLVAMLAVLQAQAGSREQAIRLHKLLTGVQPSEAVIRQMATAIENQDIPAAARTAMENRYFWDVTLKNFAARFTNQDSVANVTLNDAVTTIVGIVANDEPFTRVLDANYLYVGNNQPPYSSVPATARNHFSALESSGNPLRTSLVKVNQTIPDAAGIVTSQAWGQNMFNMGTNRAVWRMMMVNFQCTDLDGMRDTSIPGIRIRRDVDRAPGGEPQVFANKCIGCHATMDAAIGASAYFDYSEQNGLTYTPGSVVAKVNRQGGTYPDGFVATNDSWLYLGNLSANNGLAKLGWRGPASGNGLHSLAQSISQSRGFSECMAKRVFKRLCLRDAGLNDNKVISDLADGFEADGKYNMRELFANTSGHCLGEEE